MTSYLGRTSARRRKCVNQAESDHKNVRELLNHTQDTVLLGSIDGYSTRKEPQRRPRRLVSHKNCPSKQVSPREISIHISMHSLHSKVITRDFAFNMSNAAIETTLVIESMALTGQMTMNSTTTGLLREQENSHLDWTPKFHPCQRRLTVDNTMAGAPKTMMRDLLVTKGCSERQLPFEVNNTLSNIPIVTRRRSFLFLSKSNRRMMPSLDAKGSKKHHRRNHACAGMEDVMKKSLVAGLLEYQANFNTDRIL